MKMKDMHEVESEENHQPNPNEAYERGDDNGLVFVNDVESDDINILNPNFEGIHWEDEGLLHVDDVLMSCGDFPILADFPCISSASSSSSSSCSSSAPPPLNHHDDTTVNKDHHHNHHEVTCSNNNKKVFSPSTASSSASSSASWAVKKQDHFIGEENQGYALLSKDSMEFDINRMDSADCMNVMEDLGDMGLLDTDDIWDPSSLFPYEEEDLGQNQSHQEQQEHKDQNKQQEEQEHEFLVDDNDKEKHDSNPSEDLAIVFLEWLKSNKEAISADDLRNIKLKRSTIEAAAKKLGGGKEAMRRLLKLILEWIQHHHLQKKRSREGEASLLQNPNNSSSDLNYVNSYTTTTDQSNPCFNPSWNVNTHSPHLPPPYVSDPIMATYPPPPPPTSMHGFMGDPSLFTVSHYNQNHQYPSPSTDYMLGSSPSSWPPQPPPQFSLSSHYPSYPDSHHLTHPPQLSGSFTNYQNQQYPPCQMFQGHGGDGSLIRLGSSATKEARKKRMARQRRFFSHHQRHNQNQNHHHHHHHQSTEQQTRVYTDINCTPSTIQGVNNNQGNWVFWPSSASPPPPMTSSVPPMVVSDGLPPQSDPPQPMQPQNYQRQASIEKRHGSKPEKNLKFLLQKVLKQSDVGNLGRIVLPKKEAETYLPELEARDGITIAMEDIGTSRVWNMRYRFWPNNKSRMYLLENTGDFVRSNGLQEGDFIVIYSDVKCGKYMIRGVKVRQPGSKTEVKKSTKAHRNVHSFNSSDGSSSSSMMKQAVMT